MISNFVDTTTDGAATDYLARVTGLGVEYALVVTVGADFDTEPNSNGDNAQDITGVGAVIATRRPRADGARRAAGRRPGARRRARRWWGRRRGARR